jgi:hypothetical protein
MHQNLSITLVCSLVALAVTGSPRHNEAHVRVVGSPAKLLQLSNTGRPAANM